MDDDELLANWLAGPGARTTAEDRERWLRLTREGRIPRRKVELTPERFAELRRQAEELYG